jgi:hypothetical protein
MGRQLVLVAMVAAFACVSAELAASHCVTIRGSTSDRLRVASTVNTPIMLFHRVELVALAGAAISVLGLFGAYRSNCIGKEATEFIGGILRLCWVGASAAAAIAAVLSLAYAGIAQGYEQQAGFNPWIHQGFGPCILLELASLFGIVGGLLVGPPAGWLGNDAPQWW